MALALALGPGILDLDRTGSGRVLALHGGFFVRSAEDAFVFRASPVLAATSACTDGADHWVTSALGLLWHERDGIWKARFVPELASATDVQVLADQGRTWLRVEGRVLESGASAPSGRLVRAHGTLHVMADDGVYTFADGQFTRILEKSGLRAIGPADSGGLYLVDASGLSVFAGSVTPLRSGNENVYYAEVAPDGTIALAGDAREGRVAVVVRDRHGNETGRWKVDPPVIAIVDRPTPRLLGEFSTIPRMAIKRLVDDGLTLDIGGAPFETPLPHSRGERWTTAMTVGDEAWSVLDRALLIESPGAATTRYAFAAPLHGLSRDPFGQPLLLDRWGTQHVFDGSRFDASAAPGEGDLIDAVILEGRAILRLVRARSVTDVPLHGIEPPVDALLLDADGAPLQRQLDKAVAELALVRVPAPAEKAHAALAGWTRVGRTAAGVALAELLAGTDDAPGPAANAAVAAAVMRELPASAAFYVLSNVAFAAVLDTPTWIVCGREDRPAVLASLVR